MHLLVFFCALFALEPPAQAACPKNKKEWQAQGPKLLVESASRQNAKVELPDFSARLGKSATGKATPFQARKKNFVLVEANDKETSLFLSGVMKCDSLRQEPVLVSLTWVKGTQSGIVKIAPQ